MASRFVREAASGDTLSTRRFLAAWAVISVICAAAAHARVADTQPTAPDVVSVTPREDPHRILHSPDMGWVLYENYPIDSRPGGSSTLVNLPQVNFDGVDSVAIMFSWADIETGDGTYDFSKTDYAYDYWAARGKQIQLRLSTAPLLWWSNLSPPAGMGVPDFVLRHMPAEAKQIRRTEGLAYTVVDARNPYYLSRLARFLAAVNDHFNAKRPVTLIDLRGFGLWGEWHSGFRYPSTESRRAGLAGVIDAWSAAFPGHWLALSYSYDPDSPKDLWDGPTDRYDPAFARTYEQYLRFAAFDYAMTKPNVTLRRDGVGGAVHSNERRLNDEAFNTLTKGPMVCEFLGGYTSAKAGGDKYVARMIDDALSLHPNYINLLGWQGADALAFMHERRDLFNRGLREMGYRLVPTRISYPAVVGADFQIDTSWVNRGVGRAMRDFSLNVLLTDASGKSVASCDAGPMPTSRWVKASSYEWSGKVTLKNVPSGRYTLRVAVLDPRSGRNISLPLREGNADDGYAIGTVDYK